MGFADKGFEYKPFGVNYQMALTSFEFLAAIVAMFAALLRGFDGLAVDAGGAGFPEFRGSGRGGRLCLPGRADG